VFGTTTKRTESYAQRIDEHGLPETLQLDVYWPDGDPSPVNRPAVVFVHGSGFVGGNREDPGMVALAESFARKGYLTTSTTTARGRRRQHDLEHRDVEQVIDEAQQDVRRGAPPQGQRPAIGHEEPSCSPDARRRHQR
jgi:acetyl esterase/lipase